MLVIKKRSTYFSIENAHCTGKKIDLQLKVDSIETKFTGKKKFDKKI